MTAENSSPLSELSPNVSWDDLPDAIAEPELPESQDKPDVVGMVKATAGTCSVCGLEIVRAPGARGRLPKMHEDCRPARMAGTRRVSGTRHSKAEAEADEAVATIKKIYVKSAIAMSMVDKFDGFCMMANWPAIESNLRGVLVKYEWFRRELLNAKSSGSIVGLIISIFLMLMPMAAHHGLIPSKRISEYLVALPVQLFKLSKQMKDGEERLTEMMEEKLSESTVKRVPTDGAPA